MNKLNLRDKFEAMIVGWAIWDSMWLPVEMMTKKQIQEKYWYLTEFKETKDNIFFEKWGFKEEWIGYISDDTLLTLATLDSLSESKKVDFENIWAQHIKYYDSAPYWFWRGTRSAVEDLRKWASYLNTWNPLWTGNWVMMKQSPLTMYYAVSNISEKQINEEIKTYSCITHANKISVVSAIVHNKMLINLILSKWALDKKKLIWELLKYALKYENQINNMESNWENISSKLKQIYDLIDSSWEFKISDEEILEKFGWWDEKITKSCYIWVTLPIVYSIFLKNPNFKWFLDVINIGWDTDSYWAIIGNMIWAYSGKFYPEKYEKWVRDIEEIKSKVNIFVKTFTK